MTPFEFTTHVNGLSDDIKARFWSRVSRGDGCWPWTRSRTKNGYGQFRVLEKILHAHRIAFVLSGGKLTDETPTAMHKCDNPSCCNPDHIVATTQGENMRDCARKGRFAKGERSGTSKLSTAEVLRIKRLRAEGVSSRKLAAAFGLNRSTVQGITAGRAWRHLSGEWPDVGPIQPKSLTILAQ